MYNKFSSFEVPAPTQARLECLAMPVSFDLEFFYAKTNQRLNEVVRVTPTHARATSTLQVFRTKLNLKSARARWVSPEPYSCPPAPSVTAPRREKKKLPGRSQLYLFPPRTLVKFDIVT